MTYDSTDGRLPWRVGTFFSCLDNVLCLANWLKVVRSIFTETGPAINKYSFFDIVTGIGIRPQVV